MSLCSVQNKVACAFEISVLSEPSEKRLLQPYKVIATERLKEEAIIHSIHNARPSEKLDGTCVLIAQFNGKPWVWARHDRKPNKKVEKKFRAFQSLQQKQSKGDNLVDNYVWDIEKDFREVPDHWVPASGVELVDGVAQPDTNGHIPGWVPLDLQNRQQCWHLSAVHLNKGLALVLREDGEDLEIVAVPLTELDGHTAELIGTNVNANAYNLGCKQSPLHVLVVHGSIEISEPPRLDIGQISDWFSRSPAGRVEGIVWHCTDGPLFKLHRHHTGQPWPIEEPVLSQRPVTLRVDLQQYNLTEPSTGKPAQRDNFCLLGQLSETRCDSLSAIHQLLNQT